MSFGLFWLQNYTFFNEEPSLSQTNLALAEAQKELISLATPNNSLTFATATAESRRVL